MARALTSTQVTPADELRELLASGERQLAHPRAAVADAVLLLEDFDRVDELIPKLEAAGVDLRPERARWDTLQAAALRRARSIAGELRQAGGLPALRQARGRETDAGWWWRIDECAAAARRRALVRAAAIVGGILATGALILLAMYLLTDPNVRTAARRRTSGEALISAGDPAAAAVEFAAVTELLPEDPQGWVLLGCAQEQAGDTAAAAASFARGRELSASETEFLLLRAEIYSYFFMPAPSEADLRTVLALEPDNAQAYYGLSSVLEAQDDIAGALQAVETAANLADQQGMDQLMAMARYRAAVLLQRLPLADPPPTP